MKVKLYLPYYDYNDGEFDTDESYYGEGEYSNAVYDDFMKNKDIVESHMNSYKNGSRDVFTGMDGKTYKFGAKPQEKEDKVAYSTCEVTLFNDDGNDETVDGIINRFARQESFIEMIEFDFDTSEEEFETELSLWKNEHRGIESYRDKAGDDWVLANEPKRDVKMSFKNKAGEEIFAVLRGCRIMDDSDKTSWIIYVDKISLIDSIE